MVTKYLANVLEPHIGNSLHHLRNSEDFICALGSFQVQLNDILVSFDISLFTRVPIGVLNLQSWQFDEGDIRLFHHILTSSYFSFDG